MQAMTFDQAIQQLGSQMWNTVQDAAPYIGAVMFIMFLPRLLLVLFARKEDEKDLGALPVKAATRTPSISTGRAENTNSGRWTQNEDFESNLLSKFNTWDRMQEPRECSRQSDEPRCETNSDFRSGGGGDFGGGGASGSWDSSDSSSSSSSSD